MSTFNQNRVWHSFLKNASPLVVQFTNGVQDSKFNPEEKIAYFRVRGDSTDGYYLVIENDTIVSRIESVPSNRWVKVQATGSSEDADLVVTDQGPVSSSESRSTSTDYDEGTVVGNYRHCLIAAVDLVREASDEEIQKSLLENLPSIAATLFIQWQRTNFKVPLTAEMAVQASTEAEEPLESDVVVDEEDDGTDSNPEGETEKKKKLPF